MANLRVELSEQARKHVHAIDAWWRENRRAAPDLFAQELERGLAALAEYPSPGVTYDRRRHIRRLLLRRSHYHVYFVRQGDIQYVLAIWNAFRGRGPRL